MTLKLYYQNPQMGEAWRKIFGAARDVEIVDDSILNCDTDAIVSPANSFGFMDGGLDYYLSEMFGWDLQERLQEMIRTLPEGELLVGKALVVDTGHHIVPYLIAAPTMRVPMSFHIASSVNAYLAMTAALIAAVKHPGIDSIAVSGMCTGVGRMPYETSAIQMFAAYQEIILGIKPRFGDYGDAQKYQIRLNPDGMIYG